MGEEFAKDSFATMANHESPIEPLAGDNASIAVLGLGNLLYGGEGVGIHALHMLRTRLAPTAGIALLDGGVAGLDLLPFLSSEQMDVFCREAAKELIDLRQTRADHQRGKLPAELMRHLLNNLEILSHVAASLRRVVDDSLKEMEEAERTLPSDTGES